MKGDHPGELEELVLLAVLGCGDEAYGVTVQQTIENTAGRRVTLGAVYAALERLQRKGLLESRVGGAEARPGGRAKRFYDLTPRGRTALDEVRAARAALWKLAEADDA